MRTSEGRIVSIYGFFPTLAPGIYIEKEPKDGANISRHINHFTVIIQ
jgi:hypothetical protein